MPEVSRKICEAEKEVVHLSHKPETSYLSCSNRVKFILV